MTKLSTSSHSLAKLGAEAKDARNSRAKPTQGSPRLNCGRIIKTKPVLIDNRTGDPDRRDRPQRLSPHLFRNRRPGQAIEYAQPHPRNIDFGIQRLRSPRASQRCRNNCFLTLGTEMGPRQISSVSRAPTMPCPRGGGWSVISRPQTEQQSITVVDHCCRRPFRTASDPGDRERGAMPMPRYLAYKSLLTAKILDRKMHLSPGMRPHSCIPISTLIGRCSSIRRACSSEAFRSSSSSTHV